MKIQYEHEINTGHRLYGHIGKCRNLHGHNYKITFVFEGKLDALGMVIDFAVVKKVVGGWLDMNWDHKVMLFEKDPLFIALQVWDCGAISVPFNPTAENMAAYLLEHTLEHIPDNCPFNKYFIKLTSVTVEETPTSKAIAERSKDAE